MFEEELEAELDRLMVTLSQSDLESEAGWEADDAPVIPAGRCAPAGTRVYNFTCTFLDLFKIKNLLGVAVPPATLKAAVEQAAATAVSLANQASVSLSSRTAASRSAFCAAFGLSPDDGTSRPGNLRLVLPIRRWRDFGDFVGVNLQEIAYTIDSGCAAYYCWDEYDQSGPQQDIPKCATDPWTPRPCSGANTILLGARFWQAWHAGDTVTAALHLIYELLDVDFYAVDNPQSVAKAYCYQSFVARANGLPVPQWVAQKCPAGACAPLPPIKPDPLDQFRTDHPKPHSSGPDDPNVSPYHAVKIERISQQVVDSWKTATPIRFIQLTGYADPTFQGPRLYPRDAYNAELGLRRAQAAMQAIAAAIQQKDPSVGAGVKFMPPLTAGATKAVADNATEVGRAKNRRVEIVLLR